MKNLNEKLKFIELLEEFKYIERRITKPKALDCHENDAEHSWHLTMMCLILVDDFPELNKEKVLIFALIHDIPEIYAGDTFIFDKKEVKTKDKRERKAIKKILSILDVDTKKKFKNYFEEYESKKSKESRFVYQLDKIHPMIMATLANGHHWHKYKVDMKKVRGHKLERIDDEFGFREILDHYHVKALDNNMYYYE